VSFGAIPGSRFATKVPQGTHVVKIDPPSTDASGNQSHVKGVDAVGKKLDFPLAAPAELAGLKRADVRLVDMGDGAGALSIYGQGMGAIAVLQHKASPDSGGVSGSRLPSINIDGATGTELATPLGTVVTFSRGGVSYTVAGLVPPVAAENAARGL
jgi:hypothetical protein